MKSTTLSMLVFALATAGAVGVIEPAAAAAPQAAAQANYLAAGEIERIAAADGMAMVRKIKFDGRLVEVKGEDDQQRKMKLVIDRQTGEVLKHEVKQPRLRH